MKKLTRREILGLAMASPLLAAIADIEPAQAVAQPRQAKGLGRQSFIYAPSKVVPVNAAPVLPAVRVDPRPPGTAPVPPLGQ